jgi:hypothetical protein
MNHANSQSPAHDERGGRQPDRAEAGSPLGCHLAAGPRIVRHLKATTHNRAGCGVGISYHGVR